MHILDKVQSWLMLKNCIYSNHYAFEGYNVSYLRASRLAVGWHHHFGYVLTQYSKLQMEE
jgi:hypothetical protein